MQKPVKQETSILAEEKKELLRFVIHSADLKKLLGKMSKLKIIKTSLPIVENFHVKVKTGSVIITAYDCDNAVQKELELQTEGEGCFLIPVAVKKLLDKLPGQPVVVNFDSKKSEVSIETENGVYRYYSENVENYPNLPEIGEVKGTCTISNTFVKSLKDSLAFNSAEKNRVSRTHELGVAFVPKKESITLYASDSHKLLRDIIEGSGEGASFLIRWSGVGLLLDFASQDMYSTEVKHNGTYAWVTLEDVTLIVSLEQGNLPEYDSVMPVNFNTSFSVNPKDVVNTVDRLTLSESNFFVFENERMDITAISVDYGRTFKETILIHDLEGEFQRIGFDFKMLPVFKILAQEVQVTFNIGTPDTAVVFRYTTDTGIGRTILIMPFIM